MTTNTKRAAYAAMAAEAEEAVAAVKDPDLRRVAFERILATLLSGDSPGSAKQKGRAKTQPTTDKNNGHLHQSRNGPKAYIEALISDGFFKEQRTIAQVKEQLANGGHHIPRTSLSGPLQKLTQERRLRRQKTADAGNATKTTYAYSNW